MNINDNKLDELMKKTEQLVQKKARRRRLIVSGALGTFAIAVAVIAFSVLMRLKQVPDITVENSGLQPAASVSTPTATLMYTPTPQPDGSTWDPNSWPTLEPFVPVMWDAWSKTEQVDGIETTVNIDLRHISVGYPGISYPVVEVTPGKFDLKFAQQAVDYFLGDEFYEDIPVKSDYRMRYEADKEAYENFRASTEDEKSTIQEKLNIRLEQIETAPEENVKGKIEFDENGELVLKGYVKVNAISRLIINSGSGTNSASITYYRGDLDRDYEPSETLNSDENDQYPDQMDKEVESFIEAIGRADEIVRLFDEDMHYVFGIYGHAYNPSGNLQNLSDVMADENAEKCHILYYAREYVEGIYNTIGGTGACCIDPVLYESEPKIFGSDVIRVVLDEEGLFSFSWYGKTDKVGIVDDDVEIISADEAENIFKENIFSTKWNFDDEYITELTVNKLFMEMVKTQDVRGRYLMVPAYVLKGTQTSIERYTGVITRNYLDIDNGNLFVINALDGTILKP